MKPMESAPYCPVNLLQPPRRFPRWRLPNWRARACHCCAPAASLHALGMPGEIETEAALDAQEILVDSRKVAIIGAQNFVVANTERRLASIRTMRADGRRHKSFPRDASCSDTCRWSARRPGRCRCRCRTLRSPDDPAVRDNHRVRAAKPTPSALTSIPSSQTRTQRKHRMQRGAS